MDKFYLFYPVKPFHLNQGFSEDPKTYAQFGIKGHNGWDFMAYRGQPVYAAHDGMAYYEVDNNQGEGVIIRSDKSFDYEGQPTWFKSIYWHFCDPDKYPQWRSPIPMVAYDGNTDMIGVPVKAGDLIGYADSTGFSTGDHLHFGLKPQRLKDGVWYNVEQNNGYLGAIDPAPYFNGYFAEDIPKLLGFYNKLLGLYQLVLKLWK